MDKTLLTNQYNHQTGWKIEEEKGEHHWHQQKHLGLSWVGCCGGHLLLDDHGGTHDERSDIDWVFCRKILDPKEEGGMPHLNRVSEEHYKGR